jgi:CRISPR/Cas system CMR-associated protein Cmr5 small subunit
MAVISQSGGRQVTAEYEYEDEGESEDEGDSVSRATALSKNWSPNDTHKKIALQEGVNLNKAQDIFRDWAHGHKRIDWNRTFSNALRNEQWMKKQAPAKLDIGADGKELKRIKLR